MTLDYRLKDYSMEKVANFIRTHSRKLTIFALVLAFLGTALLAWDYIQWSNIKRTEFDSEYGVVVAIVQNVAKQKWGSILIGVSIIVLIVVELFRK